LKAISDVSETAVPHRLQQLKLQAKNSESSVRLSLICFKVLKVPQCCLQTHTLTLKHSTTAFPAHLL